MTVDEIIIHPLVFHAWLRAFADCCRGGLRPSAFNWFMRDLSRSALPPGHDLGSTGQAKARNPLDCKPGHNIGIY